jgi:hypothetical protein
MDGTTWRSNLLSRGVQILDGLRRVATTTSVISAVCSDVIPQSSAPVTRKCGVASNTTGFRGGCLHKKDVIPQIWDQHSASALGLKLHFTPSVEVQ